ncbi:uncharacterized protein SCHCODRAFT_02098697 [Schizophyllum commune H4-8]|uniref:uncharacterized protein n=1 Tax=Schizophyllum commune (strain H4-8 / FGSC 9210) TaxID=578458 RepID=UPI00215F8C2F|nr:uncharacterized protein SCHCODRAFT_02098697 [Schizophyllum commune H4-8]KAI5886439.1 hypothetical protein SCHCODRAFT_02098697 [Schizophyllum commune H4-8]
MTRQPYVTRILCWSRIRLLMQPDTYPICPILPPATADSGFTGYTCCDLMRTLDDVFVGGRRRSQARPALQAAVTIIGRYPTASWQQPPAPKSIVRRRPSGPAQPFGRARRLLDYLASGVSVLNCAERSAFGAFELPPKRPPALADADWTHNCPCHPPEG